MSSATDMVFKKLPGVLSFQRGLVISDAELFNEIEGEYEAHPVYVIRHGIRGTQNVNKKERAIRQLRAIPSCARYRIFNRPIRPSWIPGPTP